MKLNTQHLAPLSQSSPTVIQPAYDKERVSHGMVHIGVGGFHRAHQAYYTEQLLNSGKANDWGICGVGLRSADAAMEKALASQDYLYTLYELSESKTPSVQVIGAIGDFILADHEPDRLMMTLISPNTRIVSLTITEGGYFTDDNTGRFMVDAPEVLYDLEHPHSPKTVFGLLTEALAVRRTSNVAPFTVMSCDNLPHNGQVARNALLSFARLRNASLAAWIDDNVSFPNAMVDRITPMTSEVHQQQLLTEYGIDDAWPVVCEPYIQWVLEDKFCNGRPEWELVGVQFTDDVTPYEEMKIRLLNGSHLAMTYIGFLLGYRFAHQTMEDPLLQSYVRTFMDEDVTPTLAEAPGIDLSDYKDSLIERFSNPVICDQLSRICSDGSSKFGKFVLPTLLDLIQQNKPLDRITLIIAAWCHYLCGVDDLDSRYDIPDPRAKELNAICCNSHDIVKDFLGLHDIFGADIPSCPAFITSFTSQLNHIKTHGVRSALETVLN